MYIAFNPTLPSAIHVYVDSAPAILNFTATLSVVDYDQIKKGGGRVQLWSDIPIDGASASYGEWTPCDFMLNTDASEGSLSFANGSKLYLDDMSSSVTTILSYQARLPALGDEESHFSFTYRILYSNGEIRWLGEFGQNGTILVERTTADRVLGLGAGWLRKAGEYVWTGMNRPLPKPHDYDFWTLGDAVSTTLAFLLTRHENRPGLVLPDYVLCPYSSITAISGPGSLFIRPFARQWADLRALKDVIQDYCSPECVAVTLVNEDSEALLVTSKGTSPVEGIIITPLSKSTSMTPITVQTDLLRALLSSQAASAPFSLLAPQSGVARLFTGTSTQATTSVGPLVISASFEIMAGVYISLLSPYTSAYTVESISGVLPTPPPSPNLSHVTFSSTMRSSESGLPMETLEAQMVEEGADAVEENEIFDDSTTYEDPEEGAIAGPLAPRLQLQSLVVHVRHLLSMASLIFAMVFQLLFAQFTPTTGSPDQTEHEDKRPVEDEEERVSVDNDNIPLTEAVIVMPEVDNAVLDQSADTQSGDNGSGKGQSQCSVVSASEAADMSEISSKTLVVDIGDQRGIVKLAIWEGSMKGNIVAEVNGQLLAVNRLKDSSRCDAGLLELRCDVEGLIRISYNHITP